MKVNTQNGNNIKEIIRIIEGRCNVQLNTGSRYNVTHFKCLGTMMEKNDKLGREIVKVKRIFNSLKQ